MLITMAKLTQEQALDGLLKLHGLTQEPCQMTRAEPQEACGLRYTDMIALTQQGIIEQNSNRRSKKDMEKAYLNK